MTVELVSLNRLNRRIYETKFSTHVRILFLQLLFSFHFNFFFDAGSILLLLPVAMLSLCPSPFNRSISNLCDTFPQKWKYRSDFRSSGILRSLDW